uniref:Uncharacterized protein n=1 Tax=Clytia hemisphaerica TaxID=252671 RepID=A0A7M5UH64_9CNID
MKKYTSMKTDLLVIVLVCAFLFGISSCESKYLSNRQLKPKKIQSETRPKSFITLRQRNCHDVCRFKHRLCNDIASMKKIREEQIICTASKTTCLLKCSALK